MWLAMISTAWFSSSSEAGLGDGGIPGLQHVQKMEEIKLFKELVLFKVTNPNMSGCSNVIQARIQRSAWGAHTPPRIPKGSPDGIMGDLK